jgi:hypothetical protein
MNRQNDPKARTPKRFRLATAAVVAGLILPAAPASAQTAPTYTYTSPSEFLNAYSSGSYCTHSSVIVNPTSASVSVTVKEYRNSTVNSQSTRTIAAGATATDAFYLTNTYTWSRLEITASSGRLVVSSSGQCHQGNNSESFTHGWGDWKITNSFGSDTENVQRANGMLDAVVAKIDALASKTDAAGGKLDGLTSRTDTANGKLDLANTNIESLAGRVGNKTQSVCVDASVRNEAGNRSQTYLTLFNSGSPSGYVTANITYATNRGVVNRTTYIYGGSRAQVDVNDALVGSRGAFPNATDVDTTITVVSGGPLHVGCTVYFARTAGAVGPVTGVRELPVSTN